MKRTPPRIELKKVYSPKDFDSILCKLKSSKFRFRRSFPPRDVNSLYFDSSRYSAISDSLSGDSERQKTRLRWYGNLLMPESPVLERKFKKGVYSWKYLTPTKLKYSQNSDGWHSAFIDQCNKGKSSLRELLPIDQCTPISVVSYRRHYYETIDRKIRVTFDSNLKFFDQTLRKAPNLKFSRKLFQTLVCEIKFNSRHVDEVGELANAILFHPQRFSKYCVSTNFKRLI